MREATVPLLRVRDWDKLYENNRSRDLGRTSWFPAPNDLSADGYAELVTHPDGAALFGAWNALLMVASRAKPRGHLVREDSRPHTAESLSRVTRLPESLVSTAIQRLLEIHLLETQGDKPRRKSQLTSQRGARIPHPLAGTLQEGAIEGKGTEHHHQEGKRKEKNGREHPRDVSEIEHSDSVRTGPSLSSKRDENPKSHYASAEDEMKAIYAAKAGKPITAHLLRAIQENLEVAGVTSSEFVAEIRTHVQNNWRNPAGFVRDLSKRFRSKTRVASDPVTMADAVARDYQCPKCFSSIPGEGIVLDSNDQLVPCVCASADYILRQRTLGVFVVEPSS